MFSSEPLLKNRLAIKRAELRGGLPTSNACQLESNWTTLNQGRLVRGMWAAGGLECERDRGIDAVRGKREKLQGCLVKLTNSAVLWSEESESDVISFLLIQSRVLVQHRHRASSKILRTPYEMLLKSNFWNENETRNRTCGVKTQQLFWFDNRNMLQRV